MLTPGRESASDRVLAAVQELLTAAKERVARVFGYARAEERPELPIHVEAVLLVDDPQVASGSEPEEVIVVFEATPIAKVPWVTTYFDQHPDTTTDVMYLRIESPTGGWERVLTPEALPDRTESPSAHDAALKNYASKAVRFVSEHTAEILAHLEERAREVPGGKRFIESEGEPSE